jgi:hypothetical protein
MLLIKISLKIKVLQLQQQQRKINIEKMVIRTAKIRVNKFETKRIT